MAIYCGSVAVVRSLPLSAVMTINFFPDFSAGAGKSILWYVVSRLFLRLGVLIPDKLRRHRGHQEHARRHAGIDCLLLL